MRRKRDPYRTDFTNQRPERETGKGETTKRKNVLIFEELSAIAPIPEMIKLQRRILDLMGSNLSYLDTK